MLPYFIGWGIMTVFEIFLAGFAAWEIHTIPSSFTGEPDIAATLISFCSVFTAIFVLVNNQKGLLGVRRFTIVTQLAKIWITLYIGLGISILAKYGGKFSIEMADSYYQLIGGGIVYIYTCLPWLVVECLYTILQDEKLIESKNNDSKLGI